MRLLPNARSWLTIVLTLAGGSSMARGQETDSAELLHRPVVNSERRFTPHEIWGEAFADPEVQAVQAIDRLPSPEQTTGVAWDAPADPAGPSVFLSAELPDEVASGAVPRIGLALQQEAALNEDLPTGQWRRHIGWGEPLVDASWRDRPWFAGALCGGAFQSDPADDVRQTSSALTGLRLGWDLDHYYGIEGRYAFSNPQLEDSLGNSLGDSQDHLLDVSALYYPLGDARWRPYLGLGIGLATHRFRNETSEWSHDTSLTMPVSVGMKYFFSPQFTLRLDAVDNVTFGADDRGARNNFFLLGSVEYRFGGGRARDNP